MTTFISLKYGVGVETGLKYLRMCLNDRILKNSDAYSTFTEAGQFVNTNTYLV
jgi:hypothetical protein